MQFLPEQGFRLESPLETASRIGWLKGVEPLLDHGVSPRHEKRIAFHDPPCALLWACYEGHMDVVKVLLEKGADVDCLHERMLNGSFLLHCITIKSCNFVANLTIICVATK